MRLLYLFVILFLSSCGSSIEKKDVSNNALLGTWEDDTYKNEFLDLKVTFDESWQFIKPSIQTGFGGPLFETTYLKSTNQDYPINIEATLEKANPLETPSVKRKVNRSLEAYNLLYEKEQIVTFKPSKSTIGGKDFLVNEFQLIEDTDTSFIHEYYRYTDGYYLSIECVCHTQLDEAAAMEFMSQIKEIK